MSPNLHNPNPRTGSLSTALKLIMLQLGVISLFHAVVSEAEGMHHDWFQLIWQIYGATSLGRWVHGCQNVRKYSEIPMVKSRIIARCGKDSINFDHMLSFGDRYDSRPMQHFWSQSWEFSSSVSVLIYVLYIGGRNSINRPQFEMLGCSKNTVRGKSL